jgi:DNA repair photolyase
MPITKETTSMRTPIDISFMSHPIDDDKREKTFTIRTMAKKLAHVIEQSVPESEEKDEALRKLQEAVFWANAGVIRPRSESEA